MQINPFYISKDCPELHHLKENGWVVISHHTSISNRFVVEVCMPLLLDEDVPFYLYAHNRDRSFQVLVSDDYIIDVLLIYLNGKVEMFCWAEILDNNLNFDTLTECLPW